MNSESSTQCTCVYTAASLTAHDLTTLLTLIWTFEFDIIESSDCVLSRSRHGNLARLARNSRCQVLLGVLSLRSEKLTLLCDSIGFPRTSLSSLHRSRTGTISQPIRLVISSLCMLFDLVPDTCSLGLQRPSELNFGEWWSNLSGTSSQTHCFSTESACDVGNAPACDSNFQCHLCGDWFSSSRGEK